MKLIPMALLLLTLTLFGACSKSNAPASMLSLSEDERRTKIAEDLELVRRYDQGLEDVIRYAKGHPELFPRDEGRMLRPEEKQALRRIFQTMLDYMRALDGIKSYWRDFHRYGMIKQRRAHAEAFFVGYNAWLVQYKHGLDFIDLTVPSKPMEKLLDEGSPEFDIPAGAFGQLKWNVIHVKSIARLLGSEQYFKTVAPALTDADCQKDATCAWALTNTAAHASASIAQLSDRAAIQFSYNTFDIARDFTFDRWFPLQRNVAEWMGDTKVRRLHTHLIRDEDLAEAAKLSEPGDIMVSRHNWYLSNVGLPGFWPHALLWVGDQNQMDAFFDDEATRSQLRARFGHERISDVLAARFPTAWEAFQIPDAEGHPRRIIEAVSEGVVFSSLEVGAHADYLGVMRANRSKLEKALTVIAAFERFGKPYDFNFDFVTDESLVCTELVYKSWRPSAERDGLELSLVDVMGRQTLPANELVRQFDAQYDQPNRSMEFVFFVDGLERQKSSKTSTIEDFRATWRRPKWDVLQE